MLSQQSKPASITTHPPSPTLRKESIIFCDEKTGARLDIHAQRLGSDLGAQLTGLAAVGLTSTLALAVTVVSHGQMPPSTTLLIAEAFFGNSIVLAFVALAWALPPWNHTALAMLRIAIMTMLYGCAWWYGGQGRNPWAVYTMVLQIGVWAASMGRACPQVWTRGGK